MKLNMQSIGSFVSLVVNVIINEYFTNTNCVMQITDKEYFLFDESKPGYLFTNLTAWTNIHPVDKCLTFLINHSEMWKTFVALEEIIIKTNNTRYNKRKYILLTDDETLIEEQYSIELLHLVPYLIIAVIQDDNETQSVDFYYNNYFRGELVKQQQWTYINETLHRPMNLNLYPEKITDTKASGPKKIFRALSGLQNPYCNPFTMTGVYINLMLLYAEKFNFTLRMNRSRIPVPVIMDKLRTREIDMGFSLFFLRLDRSEYCDYVYPIVSRFGIIVPRPKLLSGWNSYFNLLSVNIWLCMFSSIIAMLITYIASTKLFSDRYYHSPWLRVLGLLVYQPFPTILPFGNKAARIRFCIIAFSAFLLNTIYSSRLSSLIIIPRYEKKIDTREDLAKSFVYIANDDELAPAPLEFSEEPALQILFHHFHIRSLEEMPEVLKNESFAYIAYKFENVYNLDVYHKKSITKTHRLMKETLYDPTVTSYLIKNTVMLESMNTLFLQCLQAGLVNYWIFKALLIEELAFENDDSAPNRLNALSLKQVLGSFLILTTGLVIAAIVFVIELLMKRRVKIFK